MASDAVCGYSRWIRASAPRLLSLLLAFSTGVIPLAAYADPGQGKLLVVDVGGEQFAELAMAVGDRWCLVWNHSVTGFEVSDCFVLSAQAMLLESSRQPDFAAGLGHVEGRGTLRADGSGGYLIEGINEPLPGNVLRLRVGSEAVDHRIEHPRGTLRLSAESPHRRVEIRYAPP